MATVVKDFKVKAGLVVEGASATVGGFDVLTKNTDDQNYVIGLIGGSATADATPDTVVLRDANADFAANEITVGSVVLGGNDLATTLTGIDTDAQGYASAAQTAAEGFATAADTTLYGTVTTDIATAKSEAISDAATDATTKANAAQAAAEATAAADATTKANAALSSAQTYADTAEADAITSANGYTDTRETAITTAYQNYADTAEADAVATAAADATTKANTAESNAVATAAADATAKADAALTAAELYADGIETTINGTINALTTDDIAEGTNEYFTDVRAKASAADLITNATKTNIVITGDENGLTITAENGVADSTTDNLTEGSSNLYFTDARAVDAIEAVVPNFTEIDVNSVATQVAAASTGDAAQQVVAYSFDSTAHRSAKFLVKVAYGAHTQVSEVLVTLDTSDNVAITEYAIVGTNGDAAAVSADVSGGNVRLLVTPANNTSTIKVFGTLLV